MSDSRALQEYWRAYDEWAASDEFVVDEPLLERLNDLWLKLTPEEQELVRREVLG